MAHLQCSEKNDACCNCHDNFQVALHCLNVGVLCCPDDISDQLHDTQTYMYLQDNPKFALSPYTESKVDLPDIAPNINNMGQEGLETHMGQV